MELWVEMINILENVKTLSSTEELYIGYRYT